MKNDIKQIFGDGMTEALDRIVNCYENMEMTIEQLVEQMKGMDEISRAGMHVTALFKGDKELAAKIDSANKIIKQSRISDFKQVVAEGKQEEFLSTMSRTDKSSLKIDMWLLRPDFPSEIPLTADEQRYFDIIEQSIASDIEKEALSQEFESVDAWRAQNKRILSSRKKGKLE